MPVVYSGKTLKTKRGLLFIQHSAILFSLALIASHFHKNRSILDGPTNDTIILQLPHMAVYIRFCSCQLNAAALIQRKTENDSHFRDVMKVSLLKVTYIPGSLDIKSMSFALKTF